MTRLPMSGKTQIVGLIGWPVSHSVSPAMHNAAFDALGLDWRYVPLPVDAALYETWRGVLVDLTALVEGKTGLGVRDVAATLFGRRGRWAKRRGRLPDSFIDIARMFREPGDLVIDLHHVRPRAFLRNPELALRATFGAALRTGMARSGLGQRLSRVQQQLLRGESTLGRKLRYLLWIN